MLTIAVYSREPQLGYTSLYYSILNYSMIEYTNIAHLRYPRHMAYAYQIKGSRHIHCVKYTGAVIEWEYFDDWEVCKDYMVMEPDPFRWAFSEDNGRDNPKD